MAISRGRLGIIAALVVMLVGADASAQCDPNTVGCALPRAFRIHAFNGVIVKSGGKCLDYLSEVAGAPIVLNDCSRSHAFRVEQVPLSETVDGVTRPIVNHVRLVAGDKVVGVQGVFTPRAPMRKTLGLGGGGTVVLPDAPLVLQNRARVTSAAEVRGGATARDQEFVLDGDGIILAANRDLVAKVQNGRGKNGTPILMSPRQLADSEMWEFRATDGSGAPPTPDGFISVSTLPELLELLAEQGGFPPARPVARGTVITVKESFWVTTLNELVIPEDVTLRGDRRGIAFGPELAMPLQPYGVMLSLRGNHSRVTGLRLRGPNTDRRTEDLKVQSIAVDTNEKYRSIVDHNDISDWFGAGVRVSDRADEVLKEVCGPRSFTNNVRVSRNFIHNNLMQGYGYGVNARADSFPLIDGNTFLMNRHAIAMTSSSSKTSFRAWFNLVLSSAPEQDACVGPLCVHWYTHDFDIHGFGSDADDGFGGIGGNYADIFRNTFLGTNRNNFKMRGVPCEWAEFRSNVTLQERDDALDIQLTPSGTFEPNIDEDDVLRVQDTPNQFEHDNPTRTLATGDFDGDGLLDLFLSTGVAWYYAPGANAEWRLLSADKNDPISTLRFGDFDGDGRTDVVGKNGSSVMVSWGGASDWEVLNSIDAPIADLAVGDFDADGVSDLFYADGTSWWTSSAGSAPFVFRNTSGFRVSELRFGDFNRSGVTDVFGVVGGYWSFSPAGSSAWHPLHEALTDTVDGLYVADFDADNRDDIVFRQDAGFGIGVWQFSLAGLSDPVPITVTSLAMAAPGKFLEPTGRAKLLFWRSNHLVSAGWEFPQLTRHTRQDMR